MIAVDTSAIVAILYVEPDAERMHAALDAADGVLISTSTLLELQLVLAGDRALAGWTEVETVLNEYGIVAHPFDQHQLGIAREAVLKYGKGRHKAALNYGDCFAYALAKSEGIPLLCKGSDFALTDIELV